MLEKRTHGGWPAERDRDTPRVNVDISRLFHIYFISGPLFNCRVLRPGPCGGGNRHTCFGCSFDWRFPSCTQFKITSCLFCTPPSRTQEGRHTQNGNGNLFSSKQNNKSLKFKIKPLYFQETPLIVTVSGSIPSFLLLPAGQLNPFATN